MSAAALPPLSPLGTARQALGEGPALPAGLAELLAAGDLDESRAFLAWQLAELPRGLDAAEREALALLVGRLLVAEAAGSTRLAIDAKEREQLCRAHGLVAEAAAGARAPLLLDGGFLYTERAHACEERVAAALAARLSPGPFAPAAIARAVADAAARGEPAPTSEQTAAVAAALDRRIGVISGGPGTGKTTTALLLAQSLARLGVPPAAIALAAPTGKAKSRLEEAFRARLSGLVEPSPIDRELGQGCPAAQTLHRLLGIGPGLGSREHGGRDPLPFRAVVVDESSMIDLVLMDRLLAGLPAQSQLVLLGDADQLPSVSTGAVFRDLGRVATRLGRGFRADPEKPTGRRLAALAQAVRLGDTRTSAGLCVPRGAPGELTWRGIELLSPAHRDELLRKHHGRLAHAVAGAGGAGHVFTLRGGRFAEADAPRLDALAASLGQTRVLCVTRQGPSGVERTNAFLHGLAGGGPDFLPGEPVLMLRNDYERELWNGEQGIALRGREVGGPVATVVAFRARGGWLAVHPHLLGGALGLGYALTVHKAQGSEYDEVLLLLPDYPCPLSSRELLYTAISRARESVVLCGSLELFKCGVATAEQRSSGLAERLAARPGAPGPRSRGRGARPKAGRPATFGPGSPRPLAPTVRVPPLGQALRPAGLTSSPADAVSAGRRACRTRGRAETHREGAGSAMPESLALSNGVFPRRHVPALYRAGARGALFFADWSSARARTVPPSRGVHRIGAPSLFHKCAEMGSLQSQARAGNVAVDVAHDAAGTGRMKANVPALARVASLALAGGVPAISGCDSGDGGGSRGICNGANDAETPSVGLPSKFWWTSSPALIPPPSGALSIKDPSVLFFDNKWHIYATAYTSSYTMVYLDFADWTDAGTAPQVLMSTNPNLTGYKCAPQVFYFAPSATWYLIYQTQEPAYSTSTNPSDVDSWSAMTRFMSMPSIIENSQTGGIDYWVICDDVHCHMFFSADNGALYRNQTAKADFPNGFDPNNTVIVMQASQSFDLFEASNVYRIKDQSQYLLLVEALGKGRYFRSWTSDRLDGTWTPLADSQSTPFAGYANVAGADWSNDGISHGEMLRDNPDETMTIEASCNMRYLFQGRTRAGKNADGSDNYELNEYSLGLLTPAW